MRFPPRMRVGLVASVLIAGACTDGTSPVAPATGEAPVPQLALLTTTTTDSVRTTSDTPDQVPRGGTATVELALQRLSSAAGIDFIAVMDASGSMTSAGWSKEKDFVAQVAQGVLPNPPSFSRRMAVVEFGTGARIRYAFTSNQAPSAVVAGIQAIPYTAGSTHTKTAVSTAIGHFDANSPPSKNKLMILLTDGNPNPAAAENPCSLKPTLDAKGIRVVIVAMGPNITMGSVSCLVDDFDQDIIVVGEITDAAFDAVQAQVEGLVNPFVTNVTLTAEVAEGFERTAGPTKQETVLIAGWDGSVAYYDPPTREARWVLEKVGTATRHVKLDLTPAATTPCGPATALDDVRLGYVDRNGVARTLTLPDVAIEVTGCSAPEVTPAVEGTLEGGWYTSDVAVGWQVVSVDPLTSSEGCDEVVLDADTDEVTYTCTATSAAGTGTGSVTVKRDATPPVIAFSGNVGAYVHGEHIEIGCTAEDVTSGIAEATCPQVSAPASAYAPGTYTLTATAKDQAGNEATEETTFEVSADVTPPVIAPTVAGTAGEGDWFVSAVTVSWGVQDDESAVVSTAGCDPASVTADTPGDTFTCEATSAGGTSSASVEVKRDATPPLVAFSSHPATYGVADVVAIDCTVSDGTSGVATSECEDVTGPAWSFGAGAHAFEASATDHAGNASSASTGFTVQVTAAGVGALVEAWVTGSGAAGVVKALKAQLAGPRPNKNGFINYVRAQTGKSIAPDKAALLVALVEAM